MTHGSSGLDLSLVLRLLLYPLSSSIVARVFLFFLLSSFCLPSVFFLLSIVLIVVLIAFDFFLSQLECTHVPPHS